MTSFWRPPAGAVPLILMEPSASMRYGMGWKNLGPVNLAKL